MNPAAAHPAERPAKLPVAEAAVAVAVVLEAVVLVAEEAGVEKCTPPSAPSAAKIPKCLSCPVAHARFTAGIAFLSSRVVAAAAAVHAAAVAAVADATSRPF